MSNPVREAGMVLLAELDKKSESTQQTLSRQGAEMKRAEEENTQRILFRQKDGEVYPTNLGVEAVQEEVLIREFLACIFSAIHA